MARILFFGKLQDIVGQSSITLQLQSSVSDTLQLRSYLGRHFKLQGTLCENSIRIAVNSEIVPDPFPISDRDEIAFLPPVGGG